MPVVAPVCVLVRCRTFFCAQKKPLTGEASSAVPPTPRSSDLRAALVPPHSSTDLPVLGRTQMDPEASLRTQFSVPLTVVALRQPHSCEKEEKLRGKPPEEKFEVQTSESGRLATAPSNTKNRRHNNNNPPNEPPILYDSDVRQNVGSICRQNHCRSAPTLRVSPLLSFVRMRQKKVNSCQVEQHWYHRW